MTALGITSIVFAVLNLLGWSFYFYGMQGTDYSTAGVVNTLVGCPMALATAIMGAVQVVWIVTPVVYVIWRDRT